jgi:putative sigma-54 modulation protein
MQYIFKSPHLTVNAKTEGAVQKKFERFASINRIEQCQILLKKEKNGKQENYIVEGKLVLPGNDLFAREQAASFEVAAENVCLDLERQLHKHKTKLNKKTLKPADQYINERDEEME